MFQYVKKAGFAMTAASFAVLFWLSALTGVYAHEYWVTAPAPKDGFIKGNIGYGHSFPANEPIADTKIGFFKPLHLVTPDGILKMNQAGENYAFQKKIQLGKGTYMIIGSCLPGIWSQGPGGWKHQDRIQRPDATDVREVIKCAKTVFNIDGATEAHLISTPAGQPFEIIPRINPGQVKPGGKFPIQVLHQGKPAKTVVVEATFAGFSDKEYMAFKGRTDLRGRIDMIPLKSGYWIIKAVHTIDHPDKARADKVFLVSTLTVNINE